MASYGYIKSVSPCHFLEKNTRMSIKDPISLKSYCKRGHQNWIKSKSKNEAWEKIIPVYCSKKKTEIMLDHRANSGWSQHKQQWISCECLEKVWNEFEHQFLILIVQQNPAPLKKKKKPEHLQIFNCLCFRFRLQNLEISDDVSQIHTRLDILLWPSGFKTSSNIIQRKTPLWIWPTNNVNLMTHCAALTKHHHLLQKHTYWNMVSVFLYYSDKQ